MLPNFATVILKRTKMKKILLLSFIALTCCFNMNAESVPLRRRAMFQHGRMRMPSITIVEADYENRTVTLNIKKYSGTVWINIYDDNGSIVGANAANISGAGIVTMEVNNLSSGVYILSVALSSASYEGSFQVDLNSATLLQI